MTRLHRLPILAAPALAMALGMAAPAFAQDAQPAAPAVASDATAVASDAVKAATRAVVAPVQKKNLARAETPAPKGVPGRADDNVRDVHRVNRGETLTGIAQQYGVSVGALKMANKMNDNNVRIGSVMVIPST